jgi:hypothetical protein
MSSYFNPRTILVDEVIARVRRYHIVRVRGTPASGKTTLMKLVANKLLQEHGHTTPIHTLTSWYRGMANKATDWNSYLEQKTGVCGNDWLTYPAYLLLDEAQQSCWDDELWSDLFKAVQPLVGYPFIILFSSYGSPGRGYVNFEERHIPTPMVFAAGQQIALRPDESIDNRLPMARKSTRSSTWRPVGLLLDEDEAIDIVTRYASAATPSPSLSEEAKKGFFQVSGGHAGLLTSLVNGLQDIPVSVPHHLHSKVFNGSNIFSHEQEIYALMRRNIPLDWETTNNHLFSQPQNLFASIDKSPFTRGLPPSEILQSSAVARVFKKAIAEDGIVVQSSLGKKSEDHETLQSIWRNGWLHAEMSQGGIRYVFATQIHRWYVHFPVRCMLSTYET